MATSALTTWNNASSVPAILSRGYGRRSTDPVLIVSDGTRILAPVDASGDEPQMLARFERDVFALKRRSQEAANRIVVLEDYDLSVARELVAITQELASV